MFCRCRSGLRVVFCLEIFAGPLFISLDLPSAANPPFPVPTINFPFFLIQPFNRHLRPLIVHDLSFPPPSPPLSPYIKPFSFLPFSFHIPFPVFAAPSHFFSFSGFSMVKTHGGSAFRPRVRRSSPPPTGGSSIAVAAATAAAPPTTAVPTAASPVAALAAPSTAAVAAPAATQGSAAMDSSAAAPALRRYQTRVGPTPPSPPHPRPSWSAPLSKRARTSGPGESSNSRPSEPQSPPHQGLAGAPPLDLSPASIIRRPLFHCNLIPGNADCSERDLHDEVYYDFSSFSADAELRDLMLLVQRYSLEPFMTPRQFFYPRVVIKFNHTMKSRRVPNPTALHFFIDGRPGILRASDITTTFNLPVVLANSADYRKWPHPFPKEMVRLLFGDITAGSVLFRRQIPPCMLLIDHILRSNLFPLQHTIQRRGAILEALFCISHGY